ncbi:inverse autotransporter beta domain-containing protein [Xenorhabdus sp. KK7.4]|uniref:inverse autotransporter beta domain-containing protein n=1 Tax=Xenorhabdus sp. KK7.4 TaxID=1851572 RepID=UPI000C046011|nr:inverse autotransporter beta domain-containing protein [Xenorhabdus sp. KK7.4]PHM59009.1 putative invasin [Xenorhabdus sp. KK7.4]
MKFIFLNKFRRFFILMFAFLLPFVAMNTLSVSESHQDLTVSTISPIEDEENISGYIEKDKASMIAQNIQRVSGLLSSTPSQLAEQAKSYAFGRLNGTINSEVQEWLSQFGTAKINLSVDRKGKLHNSSLDLLFPLYDNKVDWLVFSQLGYRNKDSRNTVNLGFGSRYFISDWMYGFNTFFDQDITGKNNRLGLGAEAWADYLKLSANTYIRLSKWHQSRDDKLWEERPANGFDINGEFFLPAYPHIGSKLGYEKYFGDDVTLFNRDTKQKNPGFAKVGMTYTPIPLITMGIDYRHGTNKHSDARFQANLNYRFGVPLSVQLSPDRVASMRTLAGSRYDLVERNNTIVLDHREKPSLEIRLPNTLHGDSEDKETITATVTSNKPTKPVIWQAEEAFSKNGGKLPSAGNEIQIKLPKYIPNGVNSYPISATVELENGKLSKTATMTVTVKEVKLEITLPKILDGDSEEEKEVTATVNSNKPTKPVTWQAEEAFSKNGGKLPSAGNEIQIKLPKYIPNGVNSYPISATVELKNGKLSKTAEMTVTVKEVKLDISLPNTLHGYSEEEKKVTADVDSNKPTKPVIWRAEEAFIKNGGELPSAGNEIQIKLPKYIPNGVNSYPIYATVELENGKLSKTAKMTVTVNDKNTELGITLPNTLDGYGNQNISVTAAVISSEPTKLVTWEAEEAFRKNGGELPSVGNPIKIKLPKYIPDGVNSYLISATVELENGKLSKKTEMTVTVKDEDKDTELEITLPNTLDGYGNQSISVTAAVVSSEPTKPVTWKTEEAFSKNGGELPGAGNEIQIKLPKYIPNGVNSYRISAMVELENGKLAKTAEMTVTVNPFTPGDKSFINEMEVSPKETLFGNGKDEYTYRVLIVDPENGQPLRNYKLNATWEVIVNKLLHDDVYFKEQEQTTDNDGYLKALLVSKVGVDDVKVNLNITTDDGNAYASNSEKTPVNFKPVVQKAGLLIFGRHAHEYKYTHEQDKPYNVYEGLTITLIKPSPNHEHYHEDIASYGDDIEYVPSSNLVEIVNKKITFPFETFSSSKTATVIATVTKAKSGAKYAYTYTFNPKRYVFSPDVGNNGEVKLGDNSINNTCDNLDLRYSKGRQAESMTKENVIATPTNNNSLGNEYAYSPLEGFSGFGFLPYQGPPKDLKVKIKSKDKEGKFILYHYYEHGGLISFNPGASNESGRLLCQLKE